MFNPLVEDFKLILLHWQCNRQLLLAAIEIAGLAIIFKINDSIRLTTEEKKTNTESRISSFVLVAFLLVAFDEYTTIYSTREYSSSNEIDRLQLIFHQFYFDFTAFFHAPRIYYSKFHGLHFIS